MFINETVLEQGRGDDTLFAFFHAQRTGGSAFLRWLNQSFPKEKIFSRPAIGAAYAHWNKIDAARLDGFRVFGGFSQYTDKADMARPLVCLSLARHPFYRIVSVYQMSRRDKHHYRHDQAMRTTFEDYYREVDADEPSYFRNMICRRICNAPNADAAIEMMHKRYGVVATMTTLREMTALLASTYGWPAEPIAPMAPDEERYAAYELSPVFDDVMEKSAEDFKLYQFVRDYAAEAPTLAAPIAVSAGRPPEAPQEPSPAHGFTCPVCGGAFHELGPKDECPGCHSPARTRSLPSVLKRVVGPQLARTENTDLPLLAFAATTWERKLLTPYFRSLRGVSLYGKYSADNTSGVDVRDLSRFPESSFGGAFSILLFDYFAEHEAALAELARVIAPGGVLFTLILPARVRPDSMPPTVTRSITPRPGYFDYIPEGEVLLNVTVGQDWLLAAMARAGFEPLQMRVPDVASNEVSQWFIGIRREGGAAQTVTAKTEALPAAAEPSPTIAKAPRNPRPARPPGRGPASPSLTSQTRMTPGYSQEFISRLDGYDGLKSVTVKLTIPSVPFAGRTTDFAEHAWLASQSRSTAAVTCAGEGLLMVSDDLGEHWDMIEPAELAGKRIMNHFTTATGARLAQLIGWSEQPDIPEEDAGSIYRLDASGVVTDHVRNSGARWHGPRAIGEQDGVILYSDYFDNPRIAQMKPDTEEWDRKLRTNHVWRSDDDGRRWRSVFAKDPIEIRHFHFVIADPFEPGSWWLSAGDKPHECRFWRSGDNGESWREVTNPTPDIVLHPLAKRSLQSAFRATDMVILPDTLIWGTDDVMIFNDEYRILKNNPDQLAGFPKPGARVFAAKKADVLEPVDVGIGGHPFRNLVDVGPGYLAFTEAKYEPIGFEPVVYFIGKDAPYRTQELFRVPQTRDKGTGFSYSRASRAAVDGRFFSFRGAGDLAAMTPRLLQWDVAFE